MRQRLWREHYRALGLRKGDIIAWFWIGQGQPPPRENLRNNFERLCVEPI